jgi:Bacterial regulatory protein, Fis family
MIGPRSVYYDKVKEFESELITEALTRSRGIQAQAARMLGLAPPTLSSQLRRLGIQVRDFKRREPLTSFETFQRFLLWKSGMPRENNEPR